MAAVYLFGAPSLSIELNEKRVAGEMYECPRTLWVEDTSYNQPT